VKAIPQHYTIRELAGILSVSVPTIRRLERSGMLTAVRLGERGALRFSADDVAAYLDRCKSAPRQSAPPNLIAHGGRR
jgi:excisionase family DNA binding protein